MKNKYTVITIILVMVFIVMGFRYIQRVPKRHYCDFRVYHATAVKYLNRDDIYYRDTEAITPFKYPPTFAFLFSFLGLLPIKGASILFFALNYISIIVLMIFTLRAIDERCSFRTQMLLYGICILCVLRFILAVVDSGQVNVLMITLCVLGIYMMQKEKNGMAGFLFAVAAYFKYMPVLFLPYFLFRKKYRLFFMTVLWGGVFFLLPLLYSGLSTYVLYVKNWIPSIIETSLDLGSYINGKNQSLYSMVIRLLSSGHPYSLNIFTVPFTTARFIGALIGFGMYSMVLIPVAAKKQIKLFDYSMLFLCIALLNPNAWPINFVALVFPYMVLAYEVFYQKKRLALVPMILSFIIMSLTSESLASNYLEEVGYRLSDLTVGSLILYGYFCFMKYRGEEPAEKRIVSINDLPSGS